MLTHAHRTITYSMNTSFVEKYQNIIYHKNMNTSIEGNKNPTDYRGYFGNRHSEARGTKLSEEMIKKEQIILNRLADSRSESVGG